MGIKSDIDDAIQVHGAWKTRFRDFLSGKAAMDMDEISQADACKLGIWLHESGQRMLSAEDHSTAHDLHEQFHQIAGEIVQHVKQKDFEAARQALVSGGKFDQASHDLSAFLLKAAMHDAPKMPEKEAAEPGAQSAPASKPEDDSGAASTPAEAEAATTQD